MLGGYFSYWLFLGFKVNSAFDGLRAKGFEFSKTDFSGFPYRISVRIHDFSAPIGSKRLKAKEVLLSASPFSPHLWVLEGAKETFLGDAELVFSGFKASLRLNNDDKSPRIRRLSIIGESIKISQTPLIEKFNLHLIGEASKPHYAFSIEGEGLEKFLSPQDDFKILIMRGLLNDAALFDTDFANWRKSGKIELKYGKIQILEKSLIKGGWFDNIKGELNFNESSKISGYLIGDLQINFSGNQNIAYKDTKLIVNESKIDIAETFRELIIR